MSQAAPAADPPARILIVEDEPLIAMMVEDFCEEIGYACAGVFASVADALTAVARGGIDAAILDLHLRGDEASWPVADALAEQGIPFVIASGGRIEPGPARHADRPELAKPFTLDGIEQAIAAMLAEK